MKNRLKWTFGVALTFIVLLILLFLSHGGYGWYMPMMYGGYGMMGVGILFMWLVSLAALILIGLGIAWLVKALTVPK